MSKKNYKNCPANYDVKSQPHLKSENKQEVEAGHNAAWNKPNERIVLPCNHYITWKEANKQALESGCISILCVMCKSEYPIEVLEKGSGRCSGIVGKPSFSKNPSSQYADPKRNGNSNYGNYNNKIYPESSSNQQMARGSTELAYNVKPYKASNKNGKGNITMSQNGKVCDQGNCYKRNSQQMSGNSKGQANYQKPSKVSNQKDQVNITKSNNENGSDQANSSIGNSQQMSGVSCSQAGYQKPNEAYNVIGNIPKYKYEMAHHTKYVQSDKNINKQLSHKPIHGVNSKNDGSDLKNLSTHPGENISVPQMSEIKFISDDEKKRLMSQEKTWSHKNYDKEKGSYDNESQLKFVSANSMEYDKENITKSSSINDSYDSRDYSLEASTYSSSCLIRSEISSRHNSNSDINDYSNGGIDKPVPVPAPRNVKLDGTTLDNTSNTPISNSSTHIIKLDSAQEKGAIKKNNSFSQINTTLDSRSNAPISNSSTNRMKLDSAQEKGAIKENNSFNQIDSNSGASIPTYNSPSSEQQLQICITCTKVISQKSDEIHLNQGHEVMGMNEGIDNLRNRELKAIESLQNDIQNEFHEIHKHDTTLTASVNFLPDIYNTFKDWPLLSGSQKEKGNQILYQIQEISGKNISMDKPISFMDSENLRHAVNKSKIQVENWFKETSNRIPFWLISSWLKHSVAIILAGAISEGKEIFVVKGNQENEIAKLLFLGNRLFLSPFLKNVTTTDDVHFIKDEYVKPFFNQEASLAFMRISYGNEEPSVPIIIRVNTATFWGKQFLLMCTSESGQSFLGTKFFRNNWIGREGHHIWGGDYSNNDGSGGNVVLPNKDISLEKSPLPLLEGMIASRFGYEDRSTIFRVFLQGSKSEVTENCAFAQIEEGIEILQYAAIKGDITQVAISDVGLVAELN